mmetsp:Transcript_22735/g.51382  ORF Transcript_22735/g.51382 Transcript_22735/m.51382 type:complete len:389 (-) Transcript_22735:129-1295(-)
MAYRARLRPLQLRTLRDLEGQGVPEELLGPVAQDHADRPVLRGGGPSHAVIRRLRLGEPAGRALVELLRGRPEVPVHPGHDGVAGLAEPPVAGLLRVRLQPAGAGLPGRPEVGLAVGHGPGLDPVHEEPQAGAVVGGGHAVPLAVVHARGREGIHRQADIRRGPGGADGVDGPGGQEGLRGAADEPGEEVVVRDAVGSVVGLPGGDTDVLAPGPLGDDVEPAVVLGGAGGENRVVALCCGLHPHHVGAGAGFRRQLVGDRHRVGIGILAHMQQVRHPSHLGIRDHEHQVQRFVQRAKRRRERHLSAGLHGTGRAHSTPGRQGDAAAPSAGAGIRGSENSAGGHVLTAGASGTARPGGASGHVLHVYKRAVGVAQESRLLQQRRSRGNS